MHGLHGPFGHLQVFRFITIIAQELEVLRSAGENQNMSDDKDSTLEEDAIDEKRDSSVQETTTEFSQMPFFVDENTQDESVEAGDDLTDSFDAIDEPTTEADFDESCTTLENVDSDDE